MCDPVTALTIASVAVAATGQVVSGVSQANAARFEAKVADANAREASSEMQQRQDQQRIERTQLDRKQAQLQGAQRASMAANGVDISFGSAASVQDDARLIRNEDASALYASQGDELRGYDFRIANYRADAAADRQKASAAMVSTAFGVGSTILGGATQLSKIKNPAAWGAAR